MAEGIVTSTARPSARELGVTPDLRPLTTSELIDRGFSLYRSHFTGFLLLALLGQAPALLSQILITAGKLNPGQSEVLDQPYVFAQKMGLVFIISLIAQVIVFGFEVAVTFYIADAYLGKIPSVSGSLRKITSRLGSSIWTCLLGRVLIGLTFVFPVAAICASYFYTLFHPPKDFGMIMLVGGGSFLLIVTSLVPVLVVFMRLMVTVPALALEGLSGWKSVRRSSALVQYDPGLGILYWGEMRLSFLLLPLFIIELLALSITSLPIVIFQISEVLRHGSTGQLALPPDSTVILSQILTFLAGALIWPLYLIATTLFYYDVRIRREGFDLEFMAGQMGEAK